MLDDTPGELLFNGPMRLPETVELEGPGALAATLSAGAGQAERVHDAGVRAVTRVVALARSHRVSAERPRAQWARAGTGMSRFARV